MDDKTDKAGKADKADKDTGLKWWFINVIVPLIGSGGVVTIAVAIINRQQHQDSPPAVSSSQSPASPVADSAPQNPQPSENTATTQASTSQPAVPADQQQAPNEQEPQPSKTQPFYSFSIHTVYDNDPARSTARYSWDETFDVTIDGVYVGSIHTVGSKWDKKLVIPVKALGQHSYSLAGTAQGTGPYGSGSGSVSGEGVINVQDGAVFKLAPHYKI